MSKQGRSRPQRPLKEKQGKKRSMRLRLMTQAVIYSICSFLFPSTTLLDPHFTVLTSSPPHQTSFLSLHGSLTDAELS